MIIVNLPHPVDDSVVGVHWPYKPSNSVELYLREVLAQGFSSWLARYPVEAMIFAIAGQVITPDTIPPDGSVITVRFRRIQSSRLISK